MNAASAPGRFVYANRLRVHHLDIGDGEDAVMVLHQVTGGGETWRDHARDLHAQLGDGSRLILPDLRGHGWTDQPDSGYSLVDHERDVCGVLRALGVARVVLVGHSLGARIALHVAAAHPGTVAGVVALDPPLTGPGRPAYHYDLASLLDWRLDVERRGTAAVLGSSTRYSPEQAELRARYGAMCSVEAITASWYGFHLEDVHGAVGRLTVPCLVLLGSRGVVSPRAAAELAVLNPAVAVQRVPDAGHHVAVDNWPYVSSAIVRFLRRLDRTPPQVDDRQEVTADPARVTGAARRSRAGPA